MLSSNKKIRKPISPEAIANNYDLLTEILLRLPVKSLLRFKSVSKAWHSLISDPNFSHRLFPDPHNISGLIMHKNSQLINPEHEFVPLGDKPIDAPFNCLTFINHPLGLKIIQSCHGLLLCSSFRDQDFKYDYYIYNPTTKQFIALPPPGNQDTIVTRVSLAFDPAKSPHYKVVCVRNPDPGLVLEDQVDDHDPYSSYLYQQIEIYSSQTHSWRLSGNPFVAHVNILFERGLFCNGFIHWINTMDKDSHSLYFNVEEEEVRELPMPPIPVGWEERRCRYFGESRGHLHLIESYGPRTTLLDIYEIESDYSGWSVRYRVDLDQVTIAFPEMIRDNYDPSDVHYYMFSVLCVVREVNDEESYMVLHIPA
ncbi:hypothetical protein COLO4_37365 [Corchorus olitorius]|uniref:F-box domain-containing protein n=1 Tax=Corchorus olitorius TaxID=93759 RepID=A0A1R3G280_9ROSI|nr:hypothetical protein COLO4_37365 [Corchorus olitorius]